MRGKEMPWFMIIWQTPGHVRARQIQLKGHRSAQYRDTPGWQKRTQPKAVGRARFLFGGRRSPRRERAFAVQQASCEWQIIGFFDLTSADIRYINDVILPVCQGRAAFETHKTHVVLHLNAISTLPPPASQPPSPQQSPWRVGGKILLPPNLSILGLDIFPWSSTHVFHTPASEIPLSSLRV